MEADFFFMAYALPQPIRTHYGPMMLCFDLVIQMTSIICRNTMPVRDIFIGGGAGGHCPPLNFDNPKRSRIWKAYVVVRLAAM